MSPGQAAVRSGPSPCPAGRASRGSRRQLQDYVNLHPDLISSAILAGLPAAPGATIRWVSPLAEENYQECRDAEFLTRLGLNRLVPDLEEFWPQGGPCWDALGIVADPGGETEGGIILLEAKRHLGEVHGTGCMAVNQRSISRIRAALDQTKKLCGADPAVDWLGTLYQAANRLAHLHFLFDRLNGSAWLVNLYFVGDPIGPATIQDWEADIATNRRLLGLSAPVRNCVDVFLPALEPE